MADNYLERHQEEYEQRKQAWLRKKRVHAVSPRRLERPDDETL